jgi:hypothetical protein
MGGPIVIHPSLFVDHRHLKIPHYSTLNEPVTRQTSTIDTARRGAWPDYPAQYRRAFWRWNYKKYLSNGA